MIPSCERFVLLGAGVADPPKKNGPTCGRVFGRPVANPREVLLVI